MYEYEKQKLYSYIGENLLKYFKEYKVILAGGAITSLFCNRKINDLDIYFKSKEDCAELATELYECKIWIKAFTEKALLFTLEEKEVQFIYFKEFKKAEDIFKTFDFTINMGAFDFETEKFILNPKFISHNMNRKLEINTNTSFPINTLLRIKKYEERGYCLSKSEILKLSLAINKLKIESWEDLKEHFGGMYGMNLDDLFDKKQEFSLDLAIECMCDIELKHGFKVSTNTPDYFSDIHEDALYSKITNRKRELIKFKNYYFKVQEHKLEYYGDGYDEDFYYENDDFSKYIYSGKKLYKYVKNIGESNVFKSFYDNNFKYELGKIIEGDPKVGLYCGEFEDRESFVYSNNKDSILIELELIDPDDFGIINDRFGRKSFRSTYKKLKFVRVIYDENEL